jgi:hypothetical protein
VKEAGFFVFVVIGGGRVFVAITWAGGTGIRSLGLHAKEGGDAIKAAVKEPLHTRWRVGVDVDHIGICIIRITIFRVVKFVPVSLRRGLLLMLLFMSDR